MKSTKFFKQIVDFLTLCRFSARRSVVGAGARLRLRLKGEGGARILALTKVLERGSDL